MSTQTQNDVAVAEQTKNEEIPRFNVIIYDNDHTSYDEVVFIVARVFNKSEDEAFAIAKTVDEKGKGICGTYDHEIAEAKLLTTQMAKDYLSDLFPHRTEQINALQFSVEPA